MIVAAAETIAVSQWRLFSLTPERREVQSSIRGAFALLVLHPQLTLKVFPGPLIRTTVDPANALGIAVVAIAEPANALGLTLGAVPLPLNGCSTTSRSSRGCLKVPLALQLLLDFFKTSLEFADCDVGLAQLLAKSLVLLVAPLALCLH